jgi:hypothetical protein
MVTAQEIRHLRTASPDYEETERLKAKIHAMRMERDPLFLTGSELEGIFRWKLRSQYGRQSRLRLTNSDDGYRAITAAAFSIRLDDLDYEAELRLGTLTSLRGVGVPVASAILALADPDRYCVIDFRGWRAVFGQGRSYFEAKEYKMYSSAIRKLATELGWPMQEVDLAVWHLDQSRNPGAA